MTTICSTPSTRPPTLHDCVLERHRQRVGLGADARDHRDQAARDVADADREHHDRERRLAEDRADARCARCRSRPAPCTAIAPSIASQNGKPSERHAGQAEEGAEHHQVALGEVDRLGGLVDQHEAERDQPVDAALRDAADDDLDELQARRPCAMTVVPRRGSRRVIHESGFTGQSPRFVPEAMQPAQRGNPEALGPPSGRDSLAAFTGPWVALSQGVAGRRSGRQAMFQCRSTAKESFRHGQRARDDRRPAVDGDDQPAAGAQRRRRPDVAPPRARRFAPSMPTTTRGSPCSPAPAAHFCAGADLQGRRRPARGEPLAADATWPTGRWARRACC